MKIYNANNFSPRLVRKHAKGNSTKPFLPKPARSAVESRIGVVEKEVYIGNYPSGAHLQRHITFDELGQVVIKTELIHDGQVTELGG